jgi:hypothetical protein
MSWLPLACVGLALAVFIALAYLLRWPWAGFAEIPKAKDDAAGVQPAKTLWDWLQLLIIPLALADLAFLLNNSQSDREQRREDQRAIRQRKIAADAAREEALQAYLKQMSDLMLDRKLLRSRPRDDVRAVARTLTLTTVRRVDGERRGVAVRFLAEARLLEQSDPKVELAPAALASLNREEAVEQAPVFLTSYPGSPPGRGANLHSAELRGAILVKDDLTGVDLRRADLTDAELRGTALRSASLRGADLRWADLKRADLLRAALDGADLRHADLRRADLSAAALRGADLRHADLRHADLPFAAVGGADLRHADLRRADLKEASLRGADLRHADLLRVNLGDALLQRADLSGNV